MNIHMDGERTKRVSTITDWLGRAERKLDEHGKPAWIAAMVAGFVLFWPAGLFILGYMIWSGRMGCGNGRRRARSRHLRSGGTGNAVFDDYREATMRRLEEEQDAFTDFLERLRRAKDQAEFDRFMEERRGGGRDDAPQPA